MLCWMQTPPYDAMLCVALLRLEQAPVAEGSFQRRLHPHLAELGDDEVEVLLGF